MMSHTKLSYKETARSMRTIMVLVMGMTLLGSAALAQQQDYQLKGIFYRPDGRSSALFELKDKTQRLVSDGREIMPGIALSRVQADRVEITRAGARSWVALTGKTHGAQKDDQPQRAAAAMVDTQPIKSTQDQAYRRRVVRLKSGLIAARSEGQSRIRGGFQLQDTGLMDLLHGADLQTGDIITAINGNAFSRSEDLEEFAYTWSPSKDYRYTILRGGQTIER